MSASYPHLCINKQIVIHWLQHNLRDAATQDQYFWYLQAKFQWNNSPSTTIQWQIMQLVLRHFKRPDQKTLTKFIHEWLPLHDRYNINSASKLHLCPSCYSQSETVQHFLTCAQHNHLPIWEEMHQNLQKHFLKHDLQATYDDLLVYGLQQGHQTLVIPDPCPHLEQDHHTMYQAQQELGCLQLYYGRMLPLWVTMQNKHHPTINGIHYYTQALTIIWKAVLQVWHLCNHHLHPPNTHQTLSHCHTADP